MDFMRKMKDKEFDLAICDPPYGIGVNHNMGRRKGDKKSAFKPARWDNESPAQEYFDELFRVSKNQIVWGANHFISKMANDSSCWIMWDKGFSEDVSFAQFELAWTSFDGVCKKYDKTSAQMDRIHPTQKPTSLYRWLLKNYAKEGDKILDTHGGSMSSVLACLDMGYKITCFELDEDYYNLAKLRIQNHLSQINAFTPPYEIEFHDNTGLSILRDQRTIRY